MHSPGYEIRLRSGNKTDRGRVRQNNEDSILIQGNEKSLVAVVADGMGGAVAGEEASRIAIETIEQELLNEYYPHPDDYHNTDEEELAEILEECVIQANYNIYQRALERPEQKGMGTTLTMAFIRQSGILLAHVGDSRAYLVDGQDGVMTRITRDHSFVQALIEAGHITEEEAELHPMRNVLYRALGQSENDLDVDVIDGVHMHVNDRMILCSDGLTLHLRDDEIAEIAMQSSDPDVVCQRLIDTALERGGKDNVSVIVIVAKEAIDSVEIVDETDPELSYEDDDPTLPMRQSVMPPNDEKSDVQRHHTSSYGEGNDIMKPSQ